MTDTNSHNDAGRNEAEQRNEAEHRADDDGMSHDQCNPAEHRADEGEHGSANPGPR